MSASGNTPGGSEEIPEVVVHRGRGVGLVWLVPIVALLVGGYVAWNAFENRGVHVVIQFPTAEWVAAGKTKIRFREVEIGSVDEIKLIKDAEGVELHCTLVKEAAPHLTEGAQFWIVHPRVGGGEISGLGTLLSGAYLAFSGGPVKGKRMRAFQGLANPPVAPVGEGGLRIILRAAALHSINVGTGVYYLGKKVAEVERFGLNDDADGVEIYLYFKQEFAKLVRKNSRFWDAGGFEVTAGLGKIDVNAESFATMLLGGIEFDAPSGKRSAAAENDAHYWLHPSREDVDTFALRYGGLRVVVEAPHLGGVTVGDPVSYREMTIGSVISSELSSDSRKLRLHLNIQDRYKSLVRTNSVFWNASGISADLGLTGLHVHAESLQALLSGGVAFATPDSPGHLAAAGSVFKLHPEVKDKWLDWDPVVSRSASPRSSKPAASKNGAATEGGTAEAKKEDGSHGAIYRFFHHDGKDEKAAAADAEPRPDAAQTSAHDEKKHGLLHGRHH